MRIVTILFAMLYAPLADADIWFCSADGVIMSELNTETYKWDHDTTEGIDNLLVMKTTAPDGPWKLMHIGEKELTLFGVCGWEPSDSSNTFGFIRCRIENESERTQVLFVLNTETQRFVYFDPTGYLKKATGWFGDSFAVAIGGCSRSITE